MTVNPEISVIVPVYNVEKWLPTCLDSILGQTYGDFELFLVNDGSKDRSLDICREYEAKDKRIKVIDGPNRGSSAARNTGLELALGNWIIFCDSDDWWDLQLLEKLHTVAIDNDADIAACNIVWEYADKKVEENYAYGPTETDVCKAYIGTVYCSLCNKLVNSSLYKKYNIKGSPGIKMWDDVMMSTLLRYYSNKTVIVNEPLYHYNRMIEVSQILTYHNLTNKYPIEQIQVTKRIEDFFRASGRYDAVAKSIVCGCQTFLYGSVSGFLDWRREFPNPVFNYKVLKNFFPSKKQRLKHFFKIVTPLWLYKIFKSFRSEFHE